MDLRLPFCVSGRLGKLMSWSYFCFGRAGMMESERNLSGLHVFVTRRFIPVL